MLEYDWWLTALIYGLLAVSGPNSLSCQVQLRQTTVIGQAATSCLNYLANQNQGKFLK